MRECEDGVLQTGQDKTEYLAGGANTPKEEEEEREEAFLPYYTVPKIYSGIHRRRRGQQAVPRRRY